MKKNGNSQAVKIYSEDIWMEFGIEIELPNKKKIRTLGEKGTYRYLEIMEADTIKQVEMKEKKIRKNALRGRENYSKTNYTAKIASKG